MQDDKVHMTEIAHWPDDDFITHTIASVDQMLDAQRNEEINQAIEEQNAEHQLLLLLRDRKDNAVLEECAEVWPLDAIEEQNEIIDAEREREWDEWLSKYCQLHDVELVNGQCAACVSEEADERRNDL